MGYLQRIIKTVLLPAILNKCQILFRFLNAVNSYMHANLVFRPKDGYCLMEYYLKQSYEIACYTLFCGTALNLPKNLILVLQF
jgi:hypothetical protein